MQTRLAEVQRELAQRRVEGASGGGMVTAVATGDAAHPRDPHRAVAARLGRPRDAPGSHGGRRERRARERPAHGAGRAAARHAPPTLRPAASRAVRTSPPIERLVAALRGCRASARSPPPGSPSSCWGRRKPVPGARRRHPAAQEGDRAVRRVLRSHRRLAVRDLPRPEARCVASCAWSRSRPTSPPSSAPHATADAFTCSAARSRRSTASARESCGSPSSSARVRGGGVREVILATNPNAEGRRHRPLPVRPAAAARRAAHAGSPTACRSGGDLEYADHVTVGDVAREPHESWSEQAARALKRRRGIAERVRDASLPGTRRPG